MRRRGLSRLVGVDFYIPYWMPGPIDEDVFLYRIDTTPENARQLFLICLERIDELAETAEFYHLLMGKRT